MTPTAAAAPAGSCSVSHVTRLCLGLVQPSVAVFGSPDLDSEAESVDGEDAEGRSRNVVTSSASPTSSTSTSR